MKRGFCSRPPLVRMARIHELLRHCRMVNCRSVADELEMSPRTIQRDIDFMRYQLDLPIDYDAKTHTFAYSRPVNGALFGAASGKEAA